MTDSKINQPTPEQDWQNGSVSAANVPAEDVRHDRSVNADTRNPLPVDDGEDLPVANPSAPEFERHAVRPDIHGRGAHLAAQHAYRDDNEALAEAQRAKSEDDES